MLYIRCDAWREVLNDAAEKAPGLFRVENCCTSCHEDEDIGYSMCEDDPPRVPGRPWRRSTRIYSTICCAVARALEPHTHPDAITLKHHPERASFDPVAARKLWAAAVRAQRRMNRG